MVSIVSHGSAERTVSTIPRSSFIAKLPSLLNGRADNILEVRNVTLTHGIVIYDNGFLLLLVLGLVVTSFRARAARPPSSLLFSVLTLFRGFAHLWLEVRFRFWAGAFLACVQSLRRSESPRFFSSKRAARLLGDEDVQLLILHVGIVTGTTVPNVEVSDQKGWEYLKQLPLCRGILGRLMRSRAWILNLYGGKKVNGDPIQALTGQINPGTNTEVVVVNADHLSGPAAFAVFGSPRKVGRPGGEVLCEPPRERGGSGEWK